MQTVEKQPHGTEAWFRMVGTLMCEAANRAGLSPLVNVSLMERYTDAGELSPGLEQGLRFDIIGGVATFRVGAHTGEAADILVEVTSSASKTLNSLHSDNPEFELAFAKFERTGEIRITGDMAKLGGWFLTVHDRIVDATH